MNGQDFQKKLKELGITQAKVAEILGVTPQTVSGMMRTQGRSRYLRKRLQ